MKFRLPALSLPLLTTFCFALLFGGCASSMRPMQKDAYTYERSRDTATGLAYEYKFNVLEETGNDVYAEKAREHGVDIAAVKVTNHTDKEIDVHNDLDIYVGGAQRSPTSPKVALLNVRQRTGLYCLYLLMLPVNGYKTEVTCDGYNGCSQSSSFFPIGIILGPLLTLINTVMASTANEGVMKEISDNNLDGMKIKPGATATGYLVFFGAGSGALQIKLRK